MTPRQERDDSQLDDFFFASNDEGDVLDEALRRLCRVFRDVRDAGLSHSWSVPQPTLWVKYYTVTDSLVRVPLFLHRSVEPGSRCYSGGLDSECSTVSTVLDGDKMASGSSNKKASISSRCAWASRRPISMRVCAKPPSNKR